MYDAAKQLQPARRSLKTKIIVLVVAILVCVELAVLTWSVATYRYERLERHMTQDMLVADAIAIMRPFAPDGTNTSTPDEILNLMHSLRSNGLIVRSDNTEWRVGTIFERSEIDGVFDLDRPPGIATKIAQAFDLLLFGGGREIVLVQRSPVQLGSLVEVFTTDDELRAQTLRHALDMALVSLLVTLTLGWALVLTLDRWIVAPIIRISQEVMAFHANPEDESLDHPVSDRDDEIGGLERAVDEMRTEVRAALRQQTRLATLGAAVSRVNHDLRNMLSTAVLLSDTLERSQDPEVRRIAPRLIDSLERATRLCTDVLRFARDEKPRLVETDFALARLAEEVDDATPPPKESRVRLKIDVPDELVLHADRDQMFRALQNLLRNAYEALGDRPDGRITIQGGRAEGHVWIDVADNGPGVSQGTLQWLFHPFRAKEKLGGSGLGLAIVREIMRGHGGEIELAETGPTGTTFRLRLPQRRQSAPRPAARETAL
ncbi:MAG TPA: HAMP domain-containing sensor histidine kinase [Geminicoccus sp.]|uniref:sensor histidine kinase n=1 Tax=Geminicoccus sp. TaxID=2024832 RepID=UPI002C1EB6F5|nr:HAMP domain-containing sensor histidine kinase [Geminicoccus sp.]HWL67354.1 HAMP domain-containing sensor histidine kinase [Geminicoccus sp.]